MFRILQALCFTTLVLAFDVTTTTSCRRRRRRASSFLSSATLNEPENSQYGRQDYWNQFYQQQERFSWYAGWEDLKPFVDQFLSSHSHILVPGVGNDDTILHMYDDGYRNITAMDYAPEGIERCRDMLGAERVRSVDATETGVTLTVADARDLKGVFASQSMDAVLEKGTLDAIFLSGGDDKDMSLRNMELAVSELGRCLRPGGIWVSIAAVVDAQIQATFDSKPDEWESLVKMDDLFVTEDGYTSNNIDGSLLVWKKRK